MAKKSYPDVKYDDTDVHSLKALANGTASAGQQKRALQFFFRASGLRDMPYPAENQLEMAFNDGRKFVGWQVARLVELVGVTTDPQPKETK